MNKLIVVAKVMNGLKNLIVVSWSENIPNKFELGERVDGEE